MLLVAVDFWKYSSSKSFIITVYQKCFSTIIYYSFIIGKSEWWWSRAERSNESAVCGDWAGKQQQHAIKKTKNKKHFSRCWLITILLRQGSNIPWHIYWTRNVSNIWHCNFNFNFFFFLRLLIYYLLFGNCIVFSV